MSDRYRTIVADPPWPYDEGWPGWALARDVRAALPYPPMSLDEIAPRLEMFARRNRLGWDTWGNEALQHVEIA